MHTSTSSKDEQQTGDNEEDEGDEDHGPSVEKDSALVRHDTPVDGVSPPGHLDQRGKNRSPDVHHLKREIMVSMKQAIFL